MTADPVRECGLCGTWHSSAACGVCGGRTPATPDGPPVRVLLDFVVGPDRTVSYSSLSSARLGWLQHDGTLAARLAAIEDPSLDAVDWPRLAVDSAQAVTDVVTETLGRHAGVPSPKIRVAHRVSVHAPGVRVDAAPPWVVRAFDEAMTLAAAELSANALEFDDFRLRAYAPAQLKVRSRATVWTTRVRVRIDALAVDLPVSRLLRANEWCELDLPPLPTSVGHRLAYAATRPNGLSTSFLEVSLLGRETPLRAPITPASLGRLPPAYRKLRMAVDFGTSHVRFGFAVADPASPGSPQWRAEETPRLLERIAVPAPKGTGVDAGLLAALLPELGRYAVDQHDAWLDRVVLPSEPIDPGGSTDVLDGLVFVPPVRAMSESKLAFLRELRQAEIAAVEARTRVVEAYDRAVSKWKDLKRKQSDMLLKYISADPGPEPEKPPPFSAPALLRETVREALETNRFMAVDVGASGTFMAMTIPAWTKTSYHPRAGGEALRAAAAARPEYEAAPARMRAAVDAVLGAAVADMVELAHDARGQPFLLLLCGGAAQDPFFQSLLTAAMKSHGRNPVLADAHYLHALILLAQQAGVTGPHLDRRAHLATLESQAGLSPGTFDLVEGAWTAAALDAVAPS